MASVTPSLMELEAPVHGENVENTTDSSAATRVDDEICHPSLEMLGGEDQDLLQDLLANVVVEHPMSLTLFGGVSEPEDAGPLGIMARKRPALPTLPETPRWPLAQWRWRRCLLP